MDKNPKNNDLQNTTQKTNDQAPWTPQKPGLSSDALEGEEEFEDTKGVIRIRKSKDRQYNGQKPQKQWSTKHYTEN
jgi:hypothetical protein